MDNPYSLHCGDAVQLLPGDYAGQVDLILTSPPYDRLREYGGVAPAFAFAPMAEALLPCLKDGGIICWIVGDAVVDGSETGSSFRQALGFMERGLRLMQTLIYQKPGPRVLTPYRYLRSFEYIFVLSNGKPAYYEMLIDRPNMHPGQLNMGDAGRTGDKEANYSRHLYITPEYGRRSDVWLYKSGNGQSVRGEERDATHDHPAIMPYRLAADLIRSYCPPEGLVLDPMAGSGTTLREAVNLGRRAVGVEINPDYCRLIERRMAQGTLVTS